MVTLYAVRLLTAVHVRQHDVAHGYCTRIATILGHTDYCMCERASGAEFLRAHSSKEHPFSIPFTLLPQLVELLQALCPFYVIRYSHTSYYYGQLLYCNNQNTLKRTLESDDSFESCFFVRLLQPVPVPVMDHDQHHVHDDPHWQVAYLLIGR